MPASVFPRFPRGAACASYGDVAPKPVIVQEVAHEGGRKRYASDWFLKRFRLLPDRPHAKVPAERGNFSCHPSRFLVYSRALSRDMPSRQTLRFRGTRARVVEGRP